MLKGFVQMFALTPLELSIIADPDPDNEKIKPLYHDPTKGNRSPHPHTHITPHRFKADHPTCQSPDCSIVQYNICRSILQHLYFSVGHRKCYLNRDFISCCGFTRVVVAKYPCLWRKLNSITAQKACLATPTMNCF